MSEFANRTRVVWLSNKGRERHATIATRLKCEPRPYIVKVDKGLPGEVGTHHVVPGSRLTLDNRPAA